MQRGDNNPKVGEWHTISVDGKSQLVQIVTVRCHQRGVLAFRDADGNVMRNSDGSIKIDDSHATVEYECDCKDKNGKWLDNKDGSLRSFPGSLFTASNKKG